MSNTFHHVPLLDPPLRETQYPLLEKPGSGRQLKCQQHPQPREKKAGAKRICLSRLPLHPESILCQQPEVESKQKRSLAGADTSLSFSLGANSSQPNLSWDLVSMHQLFQAITALSKNQLYEV